MARSENLFVSQQHPISRRWVVIEDDGTSCWLYLSEPDHEKPVADCWLYNRVPAPEVSGSEASRGSAPPASAQYTGPGALMSPPRETQVSLRWSRDGESVAAFFERELAGFIVRGQARGFSRHLVASGPWGSPLDSAIFKSVFADDDTAQPITGANAG